MGCSIETSPLKDVEHPLWNWKRLEVREKHLSLKGEIYLGLIGLVWYSNLLFIFVRAPVGVAKKIEKILLAKNFSLSHLSKLAKKKNQTNKLASLLFSAQFTAPRPTLNSSPFLITYSPKTLPPFVTRTN